MRNSLFGFALVALVPLSSGAQADHRMDRMQHDTTHAMKSPCPMHLTTLGLSPQQNLAMDSLVADHERIMRSVMPARSADGNAPAAPMSDATKGIMESNMHLTMAAMRSILNDSQRKQFDAAAKAHAAEMMAKGDHDCAACCHDSMGHASPAAAMKHDG